MGRKDIRDGSQKQQYATQSATASPDSCVGAAARAPWNDGVHIRPAPSTPKRATRTLIRPGCTEMALERSLAIGRLGNYSMAGHLDQRLRIQSEHHRHPELLLFELFGRSCKSCPAGAPAVEEEMDC